MKANRVLAVTFILVLSILVACTAPPAVPASPPAPPPAPTATLVPPTATPVPPTATPLPPTAAPAPPAPTQPPALPTPVPELMDVVKAYEAAVNRDDASGISALFPEQFVNGWQDFYQNQSLSNQKQLADFYAFTAAMHDGMALTECGQSQENQVRCGATVWDDCFKAAGVPALKASLGFTIIDKKIKILSWQLAESSQADISKLFSLLTDAALWARQERPALRAKMGDSIITGEAGAALSQICQDYAATLK